MQNDRNQKKAVRFETSNLTGELKEYLFQTTRLWEKLVVLTVKFKNPGRQKKKREVN